MQLISAGTKPTIDVEKCRFCDEGNDKEIFLRHFTYSNGAVASFKDTELDGVTAYTPVGPVVICEIQDNACLLEAGHQNIKVDDSAIVQLTAPSGAVYATVQVLGESHASPGMTAYFKVDSAAPSPVKEGKEGFRLDPCGLITLGCDAQGEGGAVTELKFFEIIAAEGHTGRIQVTYYKLP